MVEGGLRKGLRPRQGSQTQRPWQVPRGCSLSGLIPSQSRVSSESLSPPCPWAFSGCWHQCSVETRPLCSRCLDYSSPPSLHSALGCPQWPRQGSTEGSRQGGCVVASPGSGQAGEIPDFLIPQPCGLWLGSCLFTGSLVCETGGHICPACSRANLESTTEKGHPVMGAQTCPPGQEASLLLTITVTSLLACRPLITGLRTWKLGVAGFLAGPLGLACVQG